MDTVSIILIGLGIFFLSIGIKLFVDSKKVISSLQRERDDLLKQNSEMADAKKKFEEEGEPEKYTNEERMFSNVVLKKELKEGKRNRVSYSLTDAMPIFKNIDEGVSFLKGMLTKIDDPTVANILPYGCLMKSDHYLAFKLIIENVADQLRALNGRKD